jgi:hypothetical protein
MPNTEENLAETHGAQKMGAGEAIPPAVVHLAVTRPMSPTKAWRIHLDLTPWDLAQRLGIGLVEYGRLERMQKHNPADRLRIATALGIRDSQLDF